LAVHQGATDHDSTVIVVTAPRSLRLAVELFADGRPVPTAPVIEEFNPYNQSTKIIHVRYRNLAAAGPYRLVLKTDSGVVADERNFSLLPRTASALRMALVSCANQHMHNSDTWGALERVRPDLVLFLGDNVYADRAASFDPISYVREMTPELMWSNYVEARRRIDFYRFKTLIPSVATWDDHDYGYNNADRTFPMRQESQAIFEIMYAQGTLPQSMWKGPGVASAFRVAGQGVLMLDGRSFRSEPGAKDETHFGSQQEEFILDFAAESTGPLWLATGCQWWGARSGTETVQSQPRAFARLLRGLRATATRCLFASGDVHFSEVMRIESQALGYPTYELTSSSMHSRTIPGWDSLNGNPRRLASTAAHNFLHVSAVAEGVGLRGLVRSLDHPSRRDIFRQDLRL
jgi:hypothetical protein